MKLVILAGGLGTRLSEETSVVPKPMVEIGGKPIIWHIMKHYSQFGINEFVICCGYKSYVIKEYFANYTLHSADVTFDLVNRTTEYHSNNSEPWKVTLVDTGDKTMTGGRLKRVEKYVNDGTFLMTYGDGLSDINISKQIEFHKSHGLQATITAVQPPGRFGTLWISDQKVDAFIEKPIGDGGWINAGFFVLEPGVIKHIASEGTSWENEPLEHLAKTGQLSAYKHHGFWQAMDTLRDKTQLNALWEQGNAPWAVWQKPESAAEQQTYQNFAPTRTLKF